jgi:hypothetical protein
MFPDTSNRTRFRKEAAGFLFSAAICIGSAGLAHAATAYKFTVIAQDGDTIGGSVIHVPGGGVINDSGVLAFGATVSCGPPEAACGLGQVYRASLSVPMAAPTLVAPGVGPKIDASGTILFKCFALAGGGSGLCTQSTVVAKIGDSIGGSGAIEFFDAWDISGNGSIVFSAGWTRRALPGLALLT